MKKELSLIVLITCVSNAQVITPAFRGEQGTDYAQWESFSSAFGIANAPDIASDSGADAGVFSANTNVVVAGSGNLYGQSGIGSFFVRDTPSFEAQNIVLQVTSLGAMDVDSVVLRRVVEGSPEILPTQIFEFGGVPVFVPFLGAFVTREVYLFQWDFSSDPVSEEYIIFFETEAANASLDQVVLDLAETYEVVPDPEAPVITDSDVPPIDLVVSEGGLTLSWEATLEGVQLQSSTTLSGDPEQWDDVDVTPVVADGVAVVVLSRTSARNFYRLSY